MALLSLLKMMRRPGLLREAQCHLIYSTQQCWPCQLVQAWPNKEKLEVFIDSEGIIFCLAEEVQKAEISDNTS